MELGLCLSFCNKRWKNPETLADFVDSLDIKKVMFSWDMVNHGGMKNDETLLQ